MWYTAFTLSFRPLQKFCYIFLRNHIKRECFIFGIKLDTDELYGVSYFQICRASTSCFPILSIFSSVTKVLLHFSPKPSEEMVSYLTMMSCIVSHIFISVVYIYFLFMILCLFDIFRFLSCFSWNHQREWFHIWCEAY